MGLSVSLLYLVGAGRSGTTLLSRLLALQEGYRAVGEVRDITDRARHALPCGCGVSHATCPFWAPVLEYLSPARTAQAWNDAVLAGQADQIRAFARPSGDAPALRRAQPVLRSVYEALSDGADVVVDESKTPWFGYLLAVQPWADVRFVEVVRPPLEVLASAQKRKDYVPATDRELAARQWLRSCVTAAVVRRRLPNPWLRLSLSTLADRPVEALQRILGRPPDGLHSAGKLGWEFESPVEHIFHSNPDKLRRGLDIVQPVDRTRTDPVPGAGPWERLATRYWDSWLRDRVSLARSW